MGILLLTIGAALGLPEGGGSAVPVDTGQAGLEPAAVPGEIETTPEDVKELESGSSTSVPATEGIPEGELPKGLAAQVAPTTTAGRIWHVRGDASFRMLAVSPTVAAPTRYMVYRLRADVDIMPHMRAFAWGGVRQMFVAEPNESGWYPQDLQLGVNYSQELKLDFIPLELFKSRKVDLIHFARLYLPTSRDSSNQSLYVAPEWYTRAFFSVTDQLTVIGDIYFQYRFDRYAEQVGPGGMPLTQLGFGPSLGVSYTLFDNPKAGSIDVGVDGSLEWVKKYPAYPGDSSPNSAETFWNQNIGWDLYASYSPIPSLTVVAILEQNGPMLREGVIQPVFFKREETEILFWAIARY